MGKGKQKRSLFYKSILLKKTKGVVLPNDAFQDMHSLRIDYVLDEYTRDNLFFAFIAGFLHFFPGEELLIYFLSGIGPPVIPSPFFWHY